MNFLKVENTKTVQEENIIHYANDAMEKMKKWKELEDNRSFLNTDIEKGLKLKFENLISFSISNDSIYVETELHANSISRWTSNKDKNVPTFKCEVQAKNLPDTPEEFMEMKENIEKDKQESMTIMNYVLFRYPIERKN